MKASHVEIMYMNLCMIFLCTLSAHAERPFDRGVPVNVMNKVSAPVPVTQVNVYPVEKQALGQFKQSLNVTTASLYTVPSDKRLVIEYFSCASSSGSYNTSYLCYITVGYPGVTHWLPTTPYGHYKLSIESSDASNPNA